jgi:hypothetical protein
MRFEGSLTYTVPLVRKAVFAYWKRSIGVVLPIMTLFVSLDLVFMLARGDRSWIVGLCGAGAALSVAFMVALFVLHYRNGLQKLNDIGATGAKFVAEESTFTLESAIGRSTFRWQTIRHVWRYPEFWLLLVSKAHFVTVPLRNLGPEMQEFVLARIRDSGGEVR